MLAGAQRDLEPLVRQSHAFGLYAIHDQFSSVLFWQL